MRTLCSIVATAGVASVLTLLVTGPGEGRAHEPATQYCGQPPGAKWLCIGDSFQVPGVLWGCTADNPRSGAPGVRLPSILTCDTMDAYARGPWSAAIRLSRNTVVVATGTQPTRSHGVYTFRVKRH